MRAVLAGTAVRRPVFRRPAVRPEAEEFIAEAKQLLPNQENFLANPVQIFGIPLMGTTTRDGFPVEPLPHDMLYTNPTTVVLYR